MTHPPNYPDGKLSEDDAGETRVAIFADKGRLILAFEVAPQWLGFDYAGAQAFAAKILSVAELIKPEGPTS